jgi:dCTP deaminase
MVKNDRWIKDMAKKGMITPFAENQVKGGVISYGVGSYGYDMRMSDEFKIFTPLEMKARPFRQLGIKTKFKHFLTGFTDKNTSIVDPKKFDSRSFVDFKGDVCIIPPNSFALATSLEYFKIPRETIVICLGKSTYARCGIVINVTPLEPEWEGHVTIEISNTTPLPAKIYANEGIAQIIFLGADELCTISYADKTGKYQAQKGITLPKI